MSDLRRRALGGGKTPSKKASLSKAGSKAASKSTSRANSASVSRHGTDDEAAWESDGSVWSFGSLGDELHNLDDLPNTLTWQEDLADRIVRITDKDMRKKLATGGLEEALTAYNKTLQTRYCGNELEGKSGSVIDALSRSIRAGKTDKETSLACQALVLTLITDRDCTTFGEHRAVLERIITDHASLMVKVAAIHALGALTFFTEPADEDIEEIMDFFHEIIESDGTTVGATDDSGTVAAAIEEWGLLCTEISDAEDVTDRSSEAFVEQLDSTEIEVQVATGEVIALLFEKAHREQNSDDDDSEVDDDDEYKSGFIINHPEKDDKPVQKYTVYRNLPQLKNTLTALSRSSSKSVSKKNRRTQHTTFNNVLHTVDHPLHGPNYSRALDLEGREQGNRLEVKVGRKGIVKLNTWWKYVRWNALRRFLGGGILVHWQENPIIFRRLPLIMDAPSAHKRAGRIDRMTLSPYD